MSVEHNFDFQKKTRNVSRFPVISVITTQVSNSSMLLGQTFWAYDSDPISNYPPISMY